jgi:hypothetical protein
MTNADVAQLIAAGLSDGLILAAIRGAKEHAFDVSAAGLIGMTKAGASEAVLEGMLNPAAPPPEPARPAVTAVPASAWPSEVGVYVGIAGDRREVYPEIVNWRTGGLLKRMATGGLVGGYVNGWLTGGAARLQVEQPTQFVIVAPEGTSITEYQLLRLDAKGTRREFRAMSTSFASARSGAGTYAIAFEGTKQAPGVFTVDIASLQLGEYGFLPPGLNAASLASSGKMYAFSVKQ